MRIFPNVKVSVLQLVLHSCGGDLVQAIEEVLTRHKSDSASVYVSEPNSWTRSPEELLVREYRQLRAEGFKYIRGTEPFMPSSPKSAFTPISTLAKAHFMNSSTVAGSPFALDTTRSKENFPISFFLDSRLNSSLGCNSRAHAPTFSKGKDDGDIVVNECERSKRSSDSTEPTTVAETEK